MQYVLPVLFYLPVVATVYINPVAGACVSTVYVVYHFWTSRIQGAVQEYMLPPEETMDIDTLEITKWDPMEVMKED